MMRALSFLCAGLMLIAPARAAVVDFQMQPQGAVESEWTQHAFNAQRTAYAPQAVAAPWRWKWSWNGPNGTGGIVANKTGLPRAVQPVTGGGRVYVARGAAGVIALNASDGSAAWTASPGGSINSTVAFDRDTNAVFAVSSNGTLYKLSAANGAVLGSFNLNGANALPLPPAVHGNAVFAGTGATLYAVNKNTLQQIWAYAAGSALHTPPAYSPSRNAVVAGTQDLFVHAVSNANGARLWRAKPTPRPLGNDTELAHGWPVIAEGHGQVFIKYRLDWDTLWTWNPWPATNAAMRSNLQANPAQQALFVMDLDDGAVPFIANVGHGGYGNGGYMPMGPQPVVKRFDNGDEVAYVVMRGSPCQASPCDGRWDSHLGEMMLDDTTVPGFAAGHARFMQNTFFPTDEQANLTMAGDHLFGGHWMFGLAHRVVDRSAARGASAGAPITVANLPHIVTSQNTCGFNANHYCAGGLTQDGDARSLPAGFYIYQNQGAVYDRYWTEYAAWVVSAGLVLFTSCDGAVVALESGNP